MKRKSKEQYEQIKKNVILGLEMGLDIRTLAGQNNMTVNNMIRFAKIHCGYQPNSYDVDKEEFVRVWNSMNKPEVRKIAVHFGLRYNNAYRYAVSLGLINPQTRLNPVNEEEFIKAWINRKSDNPWKGLRNAQDFAIYYNTTDKNIYRVVRKYKNILKE